MIKVEKERKNVPYLMETKNVTFIIFFNLKTAIMNERQFSKDTFLEALKNPKEMKKKLKSFLEAIRNMDMEFIFQSLHILYKNIVSQQTDFVMKTNSLFGLKCIADTCNYVVIALIQVYFLPILNRLAAYDCQNTTEKRGEKFFLENGYSNSNEASVEEYGSQIVKMGTQILKAMSIIKPKKLYYLDFSNDKSEFYLSIEKIEKKMGAHIAHFTIYKDIEKLHKEYTQLLDVFDQSFSPIYAQYVHNKFKAALKNGFAKNHHDFDIRQLIKSGDLYLTQGIVQYCEMALQKSKNGSVVLNTLKFVNDLVVKGNIPVLIIFHEGKVFKSFVDDVLKLSDTDKSLKRGVNFLEHRNFKPEQRQQLYAQFLTKLEIWAHTFLKTNPKTHQHSKITKYYDLFKHVRRYEFPQNNNLEKIIKQANENENKNKSRNKASLKDLIEDLEAEEQDQCLRELKESKIQEKNAQDQLPKKSETSINIENSKYMNQSSKKAENSKKQVNDLKKNIVNELKKQQEQASQSNLKNDANVSDKKSNVKISDEQIPIDSKTSLKENVQSKHQIIELGLKQKQNQTNRKPESSKKVISQQQNKGYSGNIHIPDAIKQEERQIKIQSQKNSQSKQNIASKNSKSKQNIASEKQLGGKITQNNIITQDNYFKEKVDKQKEQFQLPPQLLESDIKKKYQKNSLIDLSSQSKPLQNSKKEINHSQKKLTAHEFKQNIKRGEKLLKSLPENEREIISKMEELLKLKKILEENIEAVDLDDQELEDVMNKMYDVTDTAEVAQQQYIRYNMNQISFSQFSSRIHQNIHLKTPVSTPKNQISRSNARIKQTSHISQKQSAKLDYLDIRIPIQPPQKVDSQIKIGHEEEQLIADPYKKTIRKFKQNAHKEEKENKQISPIVHKSENLHQEIHSMKSNSPIKQFPPDQSNLEQPSRQFHHDSDDQKIERPELNPLEVSFHQEGEKKNRQTKSFKDALSMEGFFKGSKEENLYWLKNETESLIKPVVHQKRNNSSRISVPELLQEKNKKYEKQLKMIEQIKEKKIKQLQKRLRMAQQEKQAMKQEIKVKQNEISSLKQQSNFDGKSFSRGENIQIMKDIAYLQKEKAKSKQNDFFKHKKEMNLLNRNGKLINTKIYQEYFQLFKNEKDKKKQLKNKQLLHKDKYLEIGCMGNREKKCYKLTCYITPEVDIELVDVHIQNSQNLRTIIQAVELKQIKKGKQQKVIFLIEALDIPYAVPYATFLYRHQQRQQKVRVLLPCSYHKFFKIEETSEYALKQHFKDENIIRGQQIPYSKKILKNYDSLIDYLPHIKRMEDEDGEICYAGIAAYKNIAFPLKIRIKPNQFLYAQSTSSSEMQKYIHFYVATLNNFFIKDIAWK